MRFYYTLTCVILPAALIAACSASSSKQPSTSSNHTQASISKPASDKLKIDMNKTTANNHIVLAEQDKFPLTQIIKPAKRSYQFDFNKQAMNQNDLTSLQAHADYLAANSDSILTIKGHSDTQGNRAYNKRLSYERAQKVANYLIQQGAPAEQIVINGVGDMEPLNDINNFNENRRVELEYSESRLAIK